MHNNNIIFFDGICNMCNSFVNLIIVMDKKKKFLFSPISAKKGQEIVKLYELNNKKIVDEKGVTSSVMDYPAININKNSDEQALFFDVKPGFYDVWAIQFGYSEFNENEEIEISNILSRSTEKELAFANDALDMRSPGKGPDPNGFLLK